MDPSLIVTIVLTLLATGGAGGAARLFLHRLNRRRMKRACSARRRHRRPERRGQLEASLLDVFWDLGASDFALEFMDRQGLLIEAAEEAEVDSAHAALDQLLEAHGSYSEFVSESRSVIEDFAERDSSPGSRREIYTLALRRRRVLYDADSDEAAMSPTLAEKTPGPPDPERLEAGNRRRLPPPASGEGSSGHGEVVALDDVDQLDFGDLLQSATEGRLTERLQTWWNERDLRALKSDLDDEFRALYELYADRADADPSFFEDIYDVADRWEDEAGRLRELSDEYEGAEEPTALARSVLADLASEAADRISTFVERRTAQTIETIHRHARSGDEAMAGYLVYLNRHAFFAGREPRYQRHAERIERLTHEMRQAIDAESPG